MLYSKPVGRERFDFLMFTEAAAVGVSNVVRSATPGAGEIGGDKVSRPNSSLLSPDSLPIIEATLPVVGERLGEISQVLYRYLFDGLPSFASDLFNRSNQENGEQQKALAGSIAAFATLLVTEDAPPVDQVMSRIAAKHASLGIVRAHYDLVHRALFKAIADVLGDAVTPEVAAAWDEVYWLMADSLVAQEATRYEQAGVAAGSVWHVLTVVGRREVAPGVWTFTLAGGKDSPMVNWAAGQYVSVAVIAEGGARQIRQYTVMSGDDPDTWEITVEPMPGGLVSNKLIADAGIGYPLVVSIPSGTPYPVPGDNPVVLCSSGVGSALTVAVLQKMISLRETRPVYVLHVDRDEASFAHRIRIRDLLEAYRGESSLENYYVEDPEGIVPILRDREWYGGAEVYLCGSPRFMRKVRRLAVVKGVAPENIHYEVFTPDSWLGFD
ncbi:nitric oxide dioxygenase [Prescottella agglutinans]|uniref:nitric oxide dioxygenase n=2 Tax=Prescottella agglutinans TaxID=1644129 RepID=A0ABT6M5Y0_9NOCA|nr:nitric oxide dioxygenase [Prescottella agglutinans]